MTNNKRKYQLVSEPNDKATKWFTFNRNTKRKRYNEQTSLFSSTDSFILHTKKETFSMAKNDVDKKALIFLIKKSIDLFQLEKKRKSFGYSEGQVLRCDYERINRTKAKNILISNGCCQS